MRVKEAICFIALLKGQRTVDKNDCFTKCQILKRKQIDLNPAR